MQKRLIIKYALLFVIILTIALPLYPQKIDSLKQKINGKSTSDQVSVLLKISDYYYNHSLQDSALVYVNKALLIAQKINNKKLLAEALSTKAKILFEKIKYDSALALCDSALKLSDDTALIFSTKQTMANIYQALGFYHRAYKIYKEQLNYYLKKKDSLQLSKFYSNIAGVFYNLNMIDSAKKYDRMVTRLDSLMKDTGYMIIDYMNISSLFDDSTEHDSVMFYLNKGLSLAKKFNRSPHLGLIYFNIGTSYFNRNEFHKAILPLKKAITNLKKSEIYDQLAMAYLVMASSYANLGKTNLAQQYFDSASALIKSFSEQPVDLKQYLYQTGVEIFSKKNDYRQAFKYLKKYTDLQDSLQLSEQKQQLLLYSAKQNLLAKEMQLKLEKEKTKQLALKRKLYKNISIISALSLIIIFILLVFLFLSYKKLKTSAQKDAILASLYEIRHLVAQTSPENTTLNQLLGKILDKILSINELKLLPKGMIYLVNDQGQLQLAAYKNIGPLKDQCKIIKPGQCICGKALELQQTIITEEHTQPQLDIKHGHYAAPLIVDKQIFGVLNLYIKPNTKLSPYIKQFLSSLSYELAAIIQKYKQQQQIIENAKIHNELNQKLFAQSLKLEVKNNELDQAYKKLDEAYKKLDQQSRLLQETLTNLQDSIVFASYLINSYLPSRQYLDKLLGKNYFVIYKPRDIIGGDFYFVERIRDKLILLVGDATGHGVPGALLATQTVTFIRHIIFEENNFQPADILTELRNSFKTLFRHTDKTSIKNISVDMAICVIDLTSNILTYAGAFSPAIIIHQNKLIKLKPTRNPIGNYIREVDFTEQSLQLYPQDMIYLQSDGFPDQLSDNMHRLQKKNYEQILLEIHTLEPKEQEQILLDALKQWQGSQQQTDDITILGIRWTSQTSYLTRL